MLGEIKKFLKKGLFRETRETSDKAKAAILIVDVENLINQLWKISPLSGISSPKEFIQLCEEFKGLKEEERYTKVAEISKRYIEDIANIVVNGIIYGVIPKLKRAFGIGYADWIILVGKENGHGCLLEILKEKLEKEIRQRNWNALVSYKKTGSDKEADDMFIIAFSNMLLSASKGSGEALNAIRKQPFVSVLISNPKWGKVYMHLEQKLKEGKERIFILSQDGDFSGVFSKEDKITLLSNFRFKKVNKKTILKLEV